MSQGVTGPETGAPPGSAARGFIPPTPEELANVIPQIEILELLAKGGMGAVYKGRQTSLDRLVAVKILPPGIGHDFAFAERFTREARALGRLNHPNIVAVYDSGQSNGLFYFVMEFVDGVNLRHLLKEKRLTPKDALAIVPQVCEALQFAHDEGIMHRDIKPENILIDKKGRVKIADFGLAKLLGQDHPDDQLTATHQVMGTVRYMAPEQMEGARNIDHRADIYSLGVVFYELLTGELPFGRFAAPSKKVQIDVRLDEIVLRALEKEPNQRYQHAGEVKTEVESVVRTPYESAPRQKNEADTLGQKAIAALTDVIRRIAKLAASVDAIDRPYARWVGFPVVGVATFCLFATVMAFLWTRNPNADDMFSISTVVVCLSFIVFNVIWFVRRVFGGPFRTPEGPWTPEETAANVRQAARLLRTTGILTYVSWPVMAIILDSVGISFLWVVIAGTIICVAASALAKNRDPEAFPVLLAMAPITPAVVLGLPVGLRILRMLARPEVKALFEASVRAKATGALVE